MDRVFPFLAISLASHTALGHSHGPGSEAHGLSAMLREIYGGSKLREFAHMFAMDPIPDRIVGTVAGPVKTTPEGWFEQTFVSAPASVPNGHIFNKWLPIDWPQGHISVKAFAAEVVKFGPNGESPPPTPCCGGDEYTASRKDVYMHHWTVNKWQLPAQLFEYMVKIGGLDYELTEQKVIGPLEFLAGAGLNTGANGPCWDSSLHLYFGIGNDVRSLTPEGKFPYEFPEPYGVEFNADYMRKAGEFMVLNTHLIDTRGVRDFRACSECKCSELGSHGSHGWENITTGGLSCCHSTTYDGGQCKLLNDTRVSNATYSIRYTLKWQEFKEGVTLPLEVISFDATDNNTQWADLPRISGGFPEKHLAMKNDPTTIARVNDGRSGDFNGERACHIEWYVPPCTKGSDCIISVKNSWELPWPIDIVFLRNHFHAGGINMTTTVSSQANGDYKCTGFGTYTGKGELTDITTCSNSVPIRLEAGERLYVDSLYKQDDLPHYGVMSMSFVYAHIPQQQKDVLV